MTRHTVASPRRRHAAATEAERSQLASMRDTTGPTQHSDGDQVKRHRGSIRIAASQWIFGVWLVLVVLARPDRHVGALTELHIGGIFPIGGKGGWQGKPVTRYEHSHCWAYSQLAHGRPHKLTEPIEISCI